MLSLSAVDNIEREVRDTAQQGQGRVSWFLQKGLTVWRARHQRAALSPPYQRLHSHVTDGSNANSFVDSQGGYVPTVVASTLTLNLQSTVFQQSTCPGPKLVIKMQFVEQRIRPKEANEVLIFSQ